MTTNHSKENKRSEIHYSLLLRLNTCKSTHKHAHLTLFLPTCRSCKPLILFPFNTQNLRGSSSRNGVWDKIGSPNSLQSSGILKARSYCGIWLLKSTFPCPFPMYLCDGKLDWIVKHGKRGRESRIGKEYPFRPLPHRINLLCSAGSSYICIVKDFLFTFAFQLFPSSHTSRKSGANKNLQYFFPLKSGQGNVYSVAAAGDHNYRAAHTSWEKHRKSIKLNNFLLMNTKKYIFSVSHYKHFRRAFLNAAAAAIILRSKIARSI